MKNNNKFSIRKYSIGVVSVIIGLFILAGANADDRVYADNESGSTSTINASLPPISTVPEGGNPDGIDKIVDSNNNVVDKGDLSKVPAPVTPGYFALEKEAPKAAATPDEVEKEVDIDLVELGEIKYRDVKTKEIVAEKLYDNDQMDATRAGITTLPDLPKGYRFVNKGLDRVETREVVVHKFMEEPYVSEEVGVKVKLQEVNGKLAVDPNINIEADKFAPGHNLVFDVEKYINGVEKATKQVVEFVGAEGKAPKTNVQDDYKFLGEYNDETKETTWKEKTHTYSSVDVPVVEKYFADKKQAGGREVTPEKPEVTDTVTYKELGKILPVDEKGNPITGAKTPQYLNDLTDPTKALETPVPELEGYVPTVKSVVPKDPGVDTKVVYKEKITDVEKGTKQVVEFVGVEGKAPETNVQDDYKFKGKYHVVTKETVWKEKTHAYNSVDVPVVEKYFADKKQAGGQEVTIEKPEVTDTVTYKHLGRILPVDEKGNPIEKAPTPDYLNDLTDPTKALETPVPELEGYVPTVKSVLPKDPGVDTKVVYKEKITDVEKGTKQVVEFVGIEGKAPKTNVQDDYKFKGKYHIVTKETVWKEKTHAYSSVNVPVVKGYFADKKQAGGKEVTIEKPEVIDTVTYKHLGRILPVDEKGNPIEKVETPQYLNDLTDPTKALETPVPEVKGYVPTVKSVVPKDPGVDTKVVYKKVEKPKVPQKPKEQPKTPEKPKEQPKTPEKPKTPEVPKVPQTKVPEKPATPEVPKLEEKPTHEVHKKENVKLPNTGEKEAETAALGMLMLLLAGVLKTKKNK
ncbi:mucin-binding protein [Gemella sp.]